VRPLAHPLLLLAVGAACVGQGGGRVVSAPSVNGDPTPEHLEPPREDKLTACALPWTLEDVAEGPGTVIVVCPGDARRQPVTTGPMTRALDPALESARHRVCACAEKMPAPAFVDLKVTSQPEEGVANVEADEIDDELEQDPAREFYACVGKLKVGFPRGPSGACGGANATFVYPLHVDLAK
jgi:hypothetical protein